MNTWKKNNHNVILKWYMSVLYLFQGQAKGQGQS